MENKITVTVCTRYEKNDDGKVPAIDERIFLLGEDGPDNPEDWDDIEVYKDKSIGYIYDAKVSGWCLDQYADLTEPIADQIEKFIVVKIDNGVKEVVVPPKYSILYARPRPILQHSSTVPYIYDNMKACSVDKGYAEGRLQHLKSCLSKKGVTYRIEPLAQQTLF